MRKRLTLCKYAGDRHGREIKMKSPLSRILGDFLSFPAWGRQMGFEQHVQLSWRDRRFRQIGRRAVESGIRRGFRP